MRGEKRKGEGKKYRGMCLDCWGTGAMVVRAYRGRE